MTTVMDWWKERAALPSVLGFIAPAEQPDAGNFLEVPGGIENVRQVASQLIHDFEFNIYSQKNPRYRLRNIAVLSGMKVIPLCPSPQSCAATDAPTEFRSLGLCIPHVFGQLWFVARITITETSLTWRVDKTARLLPVFPIVGSTVAASFLGYLLTHFTWWSFVIQCIGWPLAAGIFSLPYALVSFEQRLERAQEYMPSVIGAWMKALDVANRQIRGQANQGHLNPPAVSNPSAVTVSSPVPTPTSPVTQQQQWVGRKTRQ